ncbi:hypothetical protein ABH926_005904 [Catenulispora sp. GP43]|uniref:hypothetical protein n=1 Tax=Catenulispora sp. GP43 TaxID=3156263 RepID=UPI003513D655
MKTPTRLLIGTLATAAALSGAVAGAAAARADDSGPDLDMNSVLCPVATTGLLATAINGLNSESLPQACGAHGPVGAAR